MNLYNITVSEKINFRIICNNIRYHLYQVKTMQNVFLHNVWKMRKLIFLNIQGNDTHGVDDSYYLCYGKIIRYRGLLRGLYFCW